MKPRTKFQLDVIARSKELPDIADLMRAWVKTDLVEYKGFATKSRVVCMQCGESFSADHVSRGNAVCPHCLTRLSVDVSRKTTDKQAYYSAYALVVAEYQVIRYFVHYCYFKAGEKAKINSWEIMQLWIKDSGKSEVVGMIHYLTNYQDTWKGEFEIRVENQAYSSYYVGRKYDIYADRFHPNSEIKGIYQKYGIDSKLEGVTFLQAIRLIPQTPRLETLIKCRMYDLLGHFVSRGTLANRYWPSVKICIRNKYKIKDAGIWIDYIDLLLHFGKDIHNAKYVCPANLKREHDRLVKKKRAIERKERLDAQRKRMAEFERKFKELKAHLLGVKITDAHLTIKTLDSVKEYLEEGDALSHCVFTNEYFLKKDSLCLSARIHGEPVETIELSLKDMTIIQSRGLANENSKYHSQILRAVSKNIHIFKSRINKPEHVQLTQ